jgi:hypothetical protein
MYLVAALKQGLEYVAASHQHAFLQVYKKKLDSDQQTKVFLQFLSEFQAALWNADP